MNHDVESDAFHALVDFIQEHVDDLTILQEKTRAIVDVAEWALFDSPLEGDRKDLAAIIAGVNLHIAALAAIAEEAQSETAADYALYKLCDWRIQAVEIARQWLGGWRPTPEEKEKGWDWIWIELAVGLQLLGFALRFLWRLRLSALGRHLRHQCAAIDFAIPPPDAGPDQSASPRPASFDPSVHTAAPPPQTSPRSAPHASAETDFRL